MATKLYDDTNFINIANAIRNKLGVSSTFKPRNMASTINSILTAQEVYPTDRASSNTNELTIIDGANKGRFTSFRVAIPPYRNGSGDPTPTNIRRYAVTSGAGRFYHGNTMVSCTYTHNIIGGYFDLAQKKVQSSFEPRLLINYEVKTFTENGVTIFYVDWWGTGDSPTILGCEYLKYVGDFSSLSEACANMPNNSIGGAKDAASGAYFCFMRADDFSTPEAFKEAIGLYSIMIACDYLYDDDFSSVDTFIKNIVRGKNSYKVEILTNTFGSSEVWQGVNIGTNFMADPELYKEKAIMDVSPQDTVSGAIANFPDGSNGYPIVEGIFNIEPIQEGTGDPSPSNVRPISGRSSCKVTRAGKNLNGFTLADFQSGVVVGNARFIGIKIPKSTVTYSTNAPTGNIWVARDFTNITNANARVYEGNPITYDNVEWLCIGLLNTDIETAFSYLTQAEKGSTATDYESYQGEDYIIPLGEDPIYGAILNVTTGVMTILRGVTVFDGSENWSVEGNNNFYTPSGRGSGAYYGEDKLLCSHFKSMYGSLGNNNNVYISNAGNLNLQCDDITHTTEGIKSWLATQVANNTPFTICYELKTPIEVQLTPEEVTTLLGTNNIFADSGDVEVKYRADIALYIEKIQNS